MFDEFGPEKILEVYNAKVGMRGFVVIDNTALGPGKGGIRMTPSVSKEEVFRLSRAMTYKNALADLPFGGAKSGIIADPKEISNEKKEEIVKAFAEALKIVSPQHYIAAPDMNMAEQEMRWWVEANGDAKSITGKPIDMGGLPHELGSTGLGVAHAAAVAAEHMKLTLAGSTVAIEGFGNVGEFAAKFLSEMGAKIVAVSDSRGLIYNKNGLNVHELTKIKHKTKTVTNYKDAEKQESHNILQINADILITAAVPDLIKISDIDKMKFKLIVCGSNIPMTEEVEEILHEKGVLVVPDFVANAGGVISSYAEHMGKTEDEMWELVKEKIIPNTKLVLEKAKKKKVKPRDAGLEIAEERIRAKCLTCK